ncbi:MAG: hypothetical protein J7501_11800 [Bdellovibrio sp.]|nr:hypothetical protein [Bdellovibrio sp.]
MKSIFASLLVTLSFSSAFATEGDLVLPGERWLAKFTAFVCEDGNTQTASIPADFAAWNVQFGKASTDYSLDNLLVKATFVEAGVTCSYSSIIFADNAAKTAVLVQSNAYAPAGGSDCAQGKAFLDSALKSNTYKYLHGRVAIYVPASDAAAQCSAQSTAVGLHFQVTGKVQE